MQLCQTRHALYNMREKSLDAVGRPPVPDESVQGQSVQPDSIVDVPAVLVGLRVVRVVAKHHILILQTRLVQEHLSAFQAASEKHSCSRCAWKQ